MALMMNDAEHPTVAPAPPVSTTDPRVNMAAERTLLAWIRTGLALMGFGFVAAKFGVFLREIAAMRTMSGLPQQSGMSAYLGIALVILGVFATVAATLRHTAAMRRIGRDYGIKPPIAHDAAAVAVLLSLIGLAMAAYLATL